AHQFGCTNVVSILGTAMTEQHVNILKRFADRIVLLFDADIAGDTAVDRAVSIFLTQPIEIQIASIPEDLDPDEYLLKHGPEAFNQLLSNATDALGYKWKQLVGRFREHANDLTGQQKALDEYLSAIAAARSTGPIDSLRWGAILARVAKLTGIAVEDLNRKFRPKSSNRPSRFSGRDAPQASHPQIPESITALDRAERQILGLLLLHPEHWNTVQVDIGANDFSGENCNKLAHLYWDHHRHEGIPVFSEFLSILNHANLAELALELVEEWESISKQDVANSIEQAIEYMKRVRREQESRSAAANLVEDDAVDVLRHLSEVASQRKKNV
ncbi:MAG TPA: toprim domain-containing protein, partial [Tepidisphaeraceae bacterium]|nr:toprim domain-containing protein [Tepidisphaeraceae bacterium]